MTKHTKRTSATWKSLVAIAVAAGLLLVVPAAPSDAGGVLRSTTVTKVVEGTGPAGVYGFEIDCDDDVTGFDLEAGESLTGSGDANVCTVTEVDDRGAIDVTYQCQVLTGVATCSAGGRTASWRAGDDGTVEITVTNSFVQPTTTTTSLSSSTTTVAPTTTAAAAAAQAAQPTFTG